jgi:hypothetical protein
LKIDCGTTLEMMHRVDGPEAQALHRQQLRQPDHVFVGRARALGGRAPLGDPRRAIMDGEHGVGVALFDGQQHQEAPPKKTSPAVTRRKLAVGQTKTQSAVAVQPFGDPFQGFGPQAGDAGLAQAVGAGRPGVGDGGKPSAARRPPSARRRRPGPRWPRSGDGGGASR